MWRRRRRLCVVEDFKRSPSIQLINKGNSADATVPWTKKKWEVMTDEYHLCPRVIYTQTRWKVSFSSTSTSGTADEYLKNSQNVSEYSDASPGPRRSTNQPGDFFGSLFGGFGSWLNGWGGGGGSGRRGHRGRNQNGWSLFG
ncbi:hypothetical protein RUM44_013625 [Polyplax serrata]|uniref:Uncharacterized protein n=1 Tax=Polyplax serrata TaxID=468196 RepID=A0ABR1BGX0_POLSC